MPQDVKITHKLGQRYTTRITTGWHAHSMPWNVRPFHAMIIMGHVMIGSQDTCRCHARPEHLKCTQVDNGHLRHTSYIYIYISLWAPHQVCARLIRQPLRPCQVHQHNPCKRRQERRHRATPAPTSRPQQPQDQRHHRHGATWWACAHVVTLHACLIDR